MGKTRDLVKKISGNKGGRLYEAWNLGWTVGCRDAWAYALPLMTSQRVLRSWQL